MSLNNIFIFLKFIFLFQIIIPTTNEIKKENIIPFNNSSCALQFCNKQNLSNIILIGEKGFNYANLVSYSNGDLVVETNSFPRSYKRMFYGIKKNGREFFKTKDSNKRTNYYSLEAKVQIGINKNQSLETELFIVTVDEGENKGKEYLVSIGKGNTYIELYDFDNDKIYRKSIEKIINRKMNSIKGTVIKYQINNLNYELFGYINLYENKLYFIENKNPFFNYFSNSNRARKTLSCFMTDLKYIMCLYTNFTLYNSKNQFNSGYIKVFQSSKDSNNFTELKGIYLEDMYIEDSIFLKAIHYKGEIGIFIYYYFYYTSDNYIKNKVIIPHNPIILFKKYDNELIDYSRSFIRTVLNQRIFNMDCSLNDLIKISDKKICFLSTSNDKDILYIVLINIFGIEKLVIRYYDIEVFNLYKFKFFNNIRAHLYNDFIAFAFSFCRNENCIDENSEYYSAFMIFNYPNGTDTDLNVTDYLLRNNDININNITINLANKVFIENNIFGNVYSEIQVIDFSGCDNINLFSSKKENIKIKNNYILEKDEHIRLELVKYNTIQCVIEYAYFITEYSYK